MIIPDYLKKGDTIGIVSTARKISPQEIALSVEEFEKWGLKVVFGEDLFNVYNQFAGTDEQRLLDFQKMLDAPQVKAIICARGGYGTIRIIDRIDFSQFRENPKWIAGFSDITVLHSHIQQNFSIATLHCAMPINFSPDASSNAVETLRKALFGENISYVAEGSPLNRPGEGKGVITGGNLSILSNLSGTVSQVNTKGKILLLEDLDEYLYHIDRMMFNLKRIGFLENLSGLIVGGMNDMRDNTVPFGKSAQEIIAEAVKQFSFPVCFNFPSGHIKENHAVALGKEVLLEVTTEESRLNYIP
ncbi:MAG: LD-carboxypeptidase [Bacteroidota bacterium]|nr:LD-carboxypeptidase [Bacteroidota bacterium]